MLQYFHLYVGAKLSEKYTVSVYRVEYEDCEIMFLWDNGFHLPESTAS